MKLKCAFETVNMGDEIVLVPVGERATEVRGVLKLNPEGYEILSLIEKAYSKDQIIDILTTKYENNRAILTNYVNTVLNTLRDADLLDE